MTLRHLLHPTDFSACAEQALRHALFLARHHDTALHVLHVAPKDLHADVTPGAGPLLDEVRDYVDRHDPADVSVKAVVRRSTRPATAILDAARELGADLIVIGTHGRSGLSRLVAGSVAEEVLREAPCPVLAVRERETAFPEAPLRHVVAPIDFSEHNGPALRRARAFAGAYGARLTLLHAVEELDLPGIYGDVANPLGATPELRERVRGELEKIVREQDAGLEATYHVEPGQAASTILDYAEREDADLIVMSSHGRTGLQRFFLGSVTEKVVRRAPCPVLVTRAFEDES